VVDGGPEVPRDVAMATNFWISLRYSFGCMIACNTLSDTMGWVFGVKLSDEDIADFEVLRNVAMSTIFWLSKFLYMTAHWRHIVNPTELAVCRRCGLMSNYFDHLFSGTTKPK